VVLNAGIVDRRSTNDLSIGFTQNDVAGEVEVLTLIKKDGTLVGKLANKPPTQQSTFFNIGGINQNTNVTSLGLIYTQQFDSFREFLQKITGEYRRNQQNKAKEEKPAPAVASKNKEAIIPEKKNKKK
ncbi:MAG: hypothetical protein EOO85_32120, partial [Pedobacter sp.]